MAGASDCVKCPLFGFSQVAPDVFTMNGGNCGLSDELCGMSEPDWNNCPKGKLIKSTCEVSRMRGNTDCLFQTEEKGLITFAELWEDVMGSTE
ncbi:MAG: hypothetical protein WCX12_00935 [Candidatus Paceibacterota bacterium]|jgi:hypothetical protein